ncbi:MAG TPA: IclR family transcriptional regulator C-terminal domain-containing protein [Conexibacter sp.]|jgi:DNA-binding IclR family transcriptional regulator
MAKIQSVQRAAAILRAVAAEPAGATGTEVAARLALAPATVHHLLQTLVGEGLLERVDRRYVVGEAVGALAVAQERQGGVPQRWRDALRDVAAKTGETTYLVAWRRSGMQLLGAVEGRGALRIAQAERGPYDHPHARAAGKVMLANGDPRAVEELLAGPLSACTRRTIVDHSTLARQLRTARRNGWAEDREEFIDGVSCIAAPLAPVGGAIAAIGVAMPTLTFRARSTELRQVLLSASLGAAGLPSQEENVS